MSTSASRTPVSSTVSPTPSGTPPAALEALARDGGRVTVSSTEWVADRLRDRLTDGSLRPGTQLSEKQVASVLDVSRNTLREAFRLLTHEGLLDYRMHHGVFVRELSAEEVSGLYWLRRSIEVEAIRNLVPLDPERAAPLYAYVERAQASAAAGDWVDVGTANMWLHTELVGLVGSAPANTVTQQVIAQVRLAFHAVNTPRELHEPFIARNRELVDLLVSGPVRKAVDNLTAYLRDSERRIVEATAARAAKAAAGADGADT